MVAKMLQDVNFIGLQLAEDENDFGLRIIDLVQLTQEKSSISIESQKVLLNIDFLCR